MVKIEVYIKKRGERDRKVVWVQRVPIRGESLMIAGEGLATVSEVVLFGSRRGRSKLSTTRYRCTGLPNDNH